MSAQKEENAEVSVHSGKSERRMSVGEQLQQRQAPSCTPPGLTVRARKSKPEEGSDLDLFLSDGMKAGPVPSDLDGN